MPRNNIKDLWISWQNKKVQCDTYMENEITIKNCKYPNFVSPSFAWEIWKPIGVHDASVCNRQKFQQQSKWHKVLSKSRVILLGWKSEWAKAAIDQQTISWVPFQEQQKRNLNCYLDPETWHREKPSVCPHYSTSIWLSMHNFNLNFQIQYLFLNWNIQKIEK